MPNRALICLATGALTVVPSLGVLATGASASELPNPPSSSTSSTTTDTSGTSTDTSSTDTTSTDTTSTTTTAPPPGHAEGYALLVDPLLAIGHSSADATSTGGSATGNAVEVGGSPLIDGTTGGTQKGAGKKNGALLDTGVTPLGQLQLTPWSAAVTSTSSGSTADGDAALLRLFLVDPTVLRAAVLQSSSHAEYNSTGSSGNSSSDGAVVNLGDGALDVHVLHAETSSSAGGSSYLVDINGNTIGSSKDANGQCALSVPSVISLSCLTATGGAATGAATAAVGQATLGTGQAGGTVVGASSSGRKAAPTLGNGTTAPTSSTPTSSGDQASAGGSLPFTGTDLPPLAALAAFALAAGAWLQQVGRRARGLSLR